MSRHHTCSTRRPACISPASSLSATTPRLVRSSSSAAIALRAKSVYVRFKNWMSAGFMSTHLRSPTTDDSIQTRPTIGRPRSFVNSTRSPRSIHTCGNSSPPSPACSLRERTASTPSCSTSVLMRHPWHARSRTEY